MNPGQIKFYEFIMDRVGEENQPAAAHLLNESFLKQGDGTFDQAYLQEFNSKMLELLKPEYKEEVQNIMQNFRG
ncbi:hypothetical protein lbkm_1348 [Lachnospiraceae bacterium KM106-2]|nr:hypothetical protein lbkm_1348 [Lachnospiraceae bacterium KM106-2]